MYFKQFPSFLYDFNYGNRIKTSIVKDITRNIRVRRDILANVTLYDEIDIIDGETPEVISEKFYGTPDYHWVVMLCNEKYDYRKDFPVPESVLTKHIADIYNPKLTSGLWYWTKTVTETETSILMYMRITSTEVPFEIAYLTAPVKINIKDDDGSFDKNINFPTDPIGLDEVTQYFYFPIDPSQEAWLTSHSVANATGGVGNVTLSITTEGREYNPVYFVNNKGNIINPTNGAIPINGDVQHRYENDLKRRIKLISPSLLETILRNYQDEL
jgi:hypothetical protein